MSSRLLCPLGCATVSCVMNPGRLRPDPPNRWPVVGLVPNWSADGSRIAFQSDRDGNDEVYVMNPDVSGQTRLTDNPAWDGSPSW